MSFKSILTDFSLLKRNAHFRHVFIARTLSLLTIGMLVVAIPKQVYDITGSSLNVAVAMAFEGIAMFIGLLLGGLLSDRKDRKWLILLARGVCGLGFAASPSTPCLSTLRSMRFIFYRHGMVSLVHWV